MFKHIWHLQDIRFYLSKKNDKICSMECLRKKKDLMKPPYKHVTARPPGKPTYDINERKNLIFMMFLAIYTKHVNTAYLNICEAGIIEYIAGQGMGDGHAK